jgi:hypothetical protein
MGYMTEYGAQLAEEERADAPYEFQRRHRDLLASMDSMELSDALHDHMETIHAHARNGAKPALIGQAVLNVLDCYCASVAARIVWGEGVVKVLTEEEGRTLGLIGVATNLGERA